EIATDRTSASVASIVAARLRDRTRHNLIVLSELPETSHWLSELKATELIQDLWPRSVARNRPVAAFHNFTVASMLPVASHFPSGEKLSEPIQPGMETEKCSPASKGPMVKNATVSAVAQILLEVRARHSARGAVRRGGRHPCLPVRVASCHAEQCLAPAGG